LRIKKINFCWRSYFIDASSFFKEYLCWRCFYLLYSRLRQQLRLQPRQVIITILLVYAGCSKKCRSKNAVCQKTITQFAMMNFLDVFINSAIVVLELYCVFSTINFCWRSYFIDASSFFKEYLCWRFYFVVVPTTTTTASTTTSSNSYNSACLCRVWQKMPK